MIVVNSRSIRLALALAVAVAVGAWHRAAPTNDLADDRRLVTEPEWLQTAAPHLHATLSGSPSLANRLTTAVDPWTAASRSGDARALAALCAGSAAAVMLLALTRAGVPPLIAALVTGAMSGASVPVSSELALAHALQLLAAAVAIACVAASSRTWRLAALAVATIVGAANHVSFAAFAAPLWALEVWRARGARPQVVVALAAGATVAGLLVAAFIIRAAASPLSEHPLGIGAVARGVMTGRFIEALQPARSTDIMTAGGLAIAAPAAVTLPLLMLGVAFAVRRTWSFTILAASLMVVGFSAASWLPDQTVATAPAWLGGLAMVAGALATIARLPSRAAPFVSVAAALMLATGGWLVPTRWETWAQSERLRTFADRSAATIDGAWTADSLANARALLARRPRGTRLVASSALLASAPDQSLVLIGDARGRLGDGRASGIPQVLRHASARTFLRSLPEWTWLAVAVHESSPHDFCAALLEALAPQRAPQPAAVVAYLGATHPAAWGDERVSMSYGAVLADSRRRAPANITVSRSTEPAITINDARIERAGAAITIVAFDAWTREVATWRSASCGWEDAPPLHDIDRSAAVFVGEDVARVAGLPVIHRDRHVMPLDGSAESAFAAGWHSAEGTAATAFRWSRAPEARVMVVVSRSQALRLTIDGQMATAPGVPNGFGFDWNGTVLQPLATWQGGPISWEVPATAVRRGLNALTLRSERVVTPGAGGDQRALGFRLTALSVAPVAPP